jgi:hypothetical protein
MLGVEIQKFKRLLIVEQERCQIPQLQRKLNQVRTQSIIRIFLDDTYEKHARKKESANVNLCSIEPCSDPMPSRQKLQILNWGSPLGLALIILEYHHEPIESHFTSQKLLDDRTCNQVAGCSLAPNTLGFQPRRARADFIDFPRVPQPLKLETLGPLRRFPLKPLPQYHLMISRHIVLSIGFPAEPILDPPLVCSMHGPPFFRSQTKPLTEKRTRSEFYLGPI